jgi:hypothetical protein
MATIREYFDTDFKNDLKAGQSPTVESVDGTINVEVSRMLHFDFDSNAKYVSLFVAQKARAGAVC